MIVAFSISPSSGDESGGVSEAVAAACDDTGDVWFVPALLGLGTPVWDYGARGTLLGLTRGSGRPEVVRAVLEGVAHRGVDLVEAAEADTGLPVPSLRIDGFRQQEISILNPSYPNPGNVGSVSIGNKYLLDPNLQMARNQRLSAGISQQIGTHANISSTYSYTINT